MRNIRYAPRGLWRDRAFTATTVATLSVALSLVVVVFAIFNAYAPRPYAVRDPCSLYEIRWQKEGGRGFSWRAYQELRERTDLFDSVIAESKRADMRRSVGGVENVKFPVSSSSHDTNELRDGRRP